MPFNDDESMGNDIQEVSAGDGREQREQEIDDIRLQTAKSIKKARLMADDNLLEDAKDIIVNVQSLLDNVDYNELNTLKSELRRLLMLMKTQETYENQGRAFVLPLETSHYSHDLAERGNEGPSSGTGKKKLRIITKREAPLEETKFNVMLELSSNETTPGLDLVTVLDISGSMQGEKLEKMKSAMQSVIEKLSPIDRLSVVTFSWHSNTLCPLNHMNKDSKAEIKERVSALAAFGGTNISAGLRKGLQVLKETRRRWVAIMLLCDGDQDPRDQDAAEVEVGNVPVYTFGLGSNYNAEVLKAISKKNKGGKFTDVRNVEKLTEEFSKCLDGLLGLIVKELKVTIKQKNSTKIKKVYAENYPQYRDDIGSVIVPLGDLHEKDLRKVIVDLLLPEVTSTQFADILEISYMCSFVGEPIHTNPINLTITRRNSAPMINESRKVTDKQLNVANKMIIEVQDLLEKGVDESLNSEVQQLKRLMNSQKLYNEQESEEVTIDDILDAESGEGTIRTSETNSTASPHGQASTVDSKNDVNQIPIEFLLDRTGVRKQICQSLNRDNNYEPWSEDVKRHLQELNLWQVIEEAPIKTTESIENVDMAGTAIQKLRHFREDWMALILINQACGFPMNLQIIDLDSARAVWDTLAKNCKKGGSGVEREFLAAVERGDWKNAESYLETHQELATARIPYSQNTVLHLASLAGEVNIVEKLVGFMKENDLEITDKDGYTALANASINGNKRIAECIVKKNPKLLAIPTGANLLPVVIAVMYNNKQLALYLYSETPPEELTNTGNINGATLLTYSIRMQLYVISLGLIEKNPRLAVALDYNGRSALYQLACMSSAFRSGSQLNFWQRLMYLCVPKQDFDRDSEETRQSVPHEDISQSVPVQDFNQDSNETRQSVPHEDVSQSVPVQDFNRDSNETQQSLPHEDVSQSVPVQDFNRDRNDTRQSVQYEDVSQRVPVQDFNRDSNETRQSVPHENVSQSVPVQDFNRDSNETRKSVQHEDISQSVPVQDFVQSSNDTSISVHEDVGQSEPAQDSNREIYNARQNWWNARCQGIKRIQDMKLLHHKLLNCICGDKINLYEDEVVNGIIIGLHEAVAKGAVKLIADVLEKFPELRRLRDKQGSTIFMKAVEFRQERVFSLLQGFAYKDKMIDWVDESGENILHKLKYNSVDKISNIQGAVLKMQKELQWFEEVEKIMPGDSFEKKNHKGKTPRQLFRHSHKNLMIDAEKWMYNTANSCIIVGILVVTITFAAAFTVPGGNHQTTGFPLFLKRKLFKVFVISDAISLFSSTSSVLIFLGILSSRYAEKDFLKSLPKKMIFGLSTLFLSITTMMLAFVATLFMMLNAESRSIVPAFLSSLAAFPLMLCARYLAPLLFEFIMSTYGPSIFHRKSKWWSFSCSLSRKFKWLLTG